MQDKKRVENFWREPPRGLFIHFVLLIKKRRLKSSQKSLTFWGHYMIHAGATVLDSLPHGSFFHATGGSVFMSIEDRMKLIPYEALVGLTSTIVAVILYLLG